MQRIQPILLYVVHPIQSHFYIMGSYTLIRLLPILIYLPYYFWNSLSRIKFHPIIEVSNTQMILLLLKLLVKNCHFNG